MVGLLSEPIGNPTINADPSAFAPSNTFGRVDPLETLKQFGRGIVRSDAELGVVDPYGQVDAAPAPNITPAEANQRYGIDGRLSFSSPVPASVAADMQSAKQDEMQRQDAAARSPGGAGAALADFGAGMLDPVNVAAGFIPVVGEARFAGMLAKAGLGSLADEGAGIIARSAVRAGSGALDAGIVQAPLVGARYALSRQEKADYTAQDALMDLAMGSVLGGGLHAAGGAVGDLVGALREGRAAPAVDGAGTAPEAMPLGAVEPGEPPTTVPAATGPDPAEAAPGGEQASLFGSDDQADATANAAASEQTTETAVTPSGGTADTVESASEGTTPPPATPDTIADAAERSSIAQPESQPSASSTPVEAEPRLAVAGAAPDPVGDAFRASPSAALVDADPQLREAVLRSSIAAVAEGRPVGANELLQVAAAEHGSIPPPAPGADRTVYAPGVPPIQVRPEVVPLDSLVASHAPDGTLNPAYPHDTGIQPRDRTSPQSQADVRSIAAGLQPERMDVSPEAQSGAPIVSPENVVESGNGRTMALGQVYSDPALADRATAYRDWLQGQGHDVAGIDKPMLIARRVSDLTPEQTRAFGRAANEATTLRMTAAETARADAARAGAALDLWRGSAVTDAGNREFVRAFLGQLPSAERGNLVDRTGALSADGARRVQSAVLALVYGDSLGPTLERMLNGDAEGMRAIAGAISDSAGAWGQMRLAAERGDIPGNLDITAPLGEAVQLIERQRRAGQPVEAAFTQRDVFGGGPSPEAAALTRLMFRDDAMAKPVGRARLADLLRDYADQAREVSPQPNMFGEPPAGPADILAAISQRPDVLDQSGFAFGRNAAADRLQDLQESPAVRRAQGAPDPEQAAIEQRAVAAGKTGPTPAADLPALEAFADGARASGILDAQSEAELAAADESAQRSQKYTDALAQAADCVLRSTV